MVNLRENLLITKNKMHFITFTYNDVLVIFDDASLSSLLSEESIVVISNVSDARGR